MSQAALGQEHWSPTWGQGARPAPPQRLCCRVGPHTEAGWLATVEPSPVPCAAGPTGHMWL